VIQQRGDQAVAVVDAATVEPVINSHRVMVRTLQGRNLSRCAPCPCVPQEGVSNGPLGSLLTMADRRSRLKMRARYRGSQAVNKIHTPPGSLCSGMVPGLGAKVMGIPASIPLSGGALIPGVCH
jgi:hypothetical protein